MKKRLEDKEKWNHDVWFKKLSTKHKLLWIYLNDICDNVGVFILDIDLVKYQLKGEYSEEEIKNVFEGKIKDLNNGQWWIIEYCFFQYGKIDRNMPKNKPHKSYVELLDKHGLWIDYLQTVNTPKEKDQDKAKNPEKVKDPDKEIDTSTDKENDKDPEKDTYTDKDPVKEKDNAKAKDNEIEPAEDTYTARDTD